MESDIIIRPISPTDHDVIKGIARQSFSIIQTSAIRLSKDDLVVTVNEQVVGALLLNVIELPKQRRIGRIGFLFVDPEHRGLGLAPRLVKEGIEQLRKLGCESVVSEVEGYNTPSSNIFHELGFRRIGTMAQIKWLGAISTVILGIRSFRLFSPGHFLWVLDFPGLPDSPTASSSIQRTGTWILNMFIALLALYVSSGRGFLQFSDLALPGVSQVFAVIAAVVLVLGLREAVMWVVAKIQGLKTEYRGWDAGAAASILIAIFFGRLFVLPGGIYPPGDGWSYRKFKRELALSAAAGTTVVMILLIAALVVRASLSAGFSVELANSIVNICMGLIIFDSMLPIGPFEGYNARRMLVYSRPLWYIFLVIGILIYGFVIFIG